MKKTIPIKCKGAGELGLDKLNDFQGELKVLTDENYEKLKSEILALGFSEPIAVWKDSKGKIHTLNGHQRVKTIKRMVEKEGYSCTGLPVSYVEADSRKQAKEKVLALTSQYGVMTSEGLKTFMSDAGLGVKTLDRFNFPEIDIPEFKLSFEPPKPEGDAKTKHISFDAYQNSPIKQITLYFQSADYDTIILALDELLAKWKLEDYSQVIWRLVRETNPIKKETSRQPQATKDTSVGKGH